MNEESLFLAALNRPDPADRRQFLDRECAGNPELRQRLDVLLAAFAAGKDRLEPPAAGQLATSDYQPGPEAGIVVGERYKLLEKIGEGGMGEVWVAKQTEPVQRKVALKLIKAGMDSQRVIVRFDAERQALAMMDHPNIAKVLDGGLTADRRPYFVMELVNGQPLTQYCDSARLTPKERLELFIPVCQAVQHAHQKGIVHRDLKPSNILVTLYDGKPVPKVIDFGVAKATGGRLTDESISTQFGAVVGTFEYMSPEQAGFSALDVDTRADIYSLGVILYELLTGLRPFDGQRLRKAAFDEMVRIIREEEPQRPSTKLSTDASLPSAAAVRGTDPKRLTALMKGELDWIVMRCLEKDRNRRYETTNALSRDVQRYLSDEAVEARPPSAMYRMRKFARRNKARVTVAAGLLVLLVGGVVGTSIGLVQADQARRDETVQRKAAERLQAEANTERKKAEYQAASVAVDLDLKFFETREYPTGMLRLARRLKLLPSEAADLRQFVMMTLFARGQETARITPGPTLPAAQLSPDGRTLIRTDVASGGTLWDMLSGRELAQLWDKETYAWHFEFDQAGRAIMMHNFTAAYIWDSPSGRRRSVIRRGDGVIHKVYMDPGANRVVTVSDPGQLPDDDPKKNTRIQLWDGVTGRLVAQLDHDDKPVTDCRFSPDGKVFLTAAGTIARAWSATDGRLLRALGGHPTDVKRVAFSPSGARAATCDANGIQWWRTADWQPDGAACSVVYNQTPPPDWTQAVFLHEDVLAAQFGGVDGNRDSWSYYNLCVVGEPKGYVLHPVAADGERVLTDDGRVSALRPLRRLDLPEGRRYPDELRRLAVGGRFFVVRHFSAHDRLLDLVAEKPLDFYARTIFPCSAKGCSFAGIREPAPVVLPSADLEIDPDTLDLWTRVLVRGELDPNTGFFVPHDEATWERNRQELLRRPRPAGEFPFPGAFAEDRLHWLRMELDSVPPANAGPLWDRLVAAEPTWGNLNRRAAYYYRTDRYAAAIRDAMIVAEIAKKTGENLDFSIGTHAAVEIAYLPDLPADQYELARRWFDMLTPDDHVNERAVLLIRANQFAAALAVLHGPEARAAARVCACFMTPFALVDAVGYEVEDVRTLLIGLCESKLGRPIAARAALERARAQHEQHYQSGGWNFYTGSRRDYLNQAEAAIEGKK
ncbi:MAG TPA: serine/threonine-protein kinase [Gemmataceae bacterium]|jgi:hypothetical protein|nr:serine/threonine-protein kinase [Gemmataceae bacterium]